MSRYSLYNPISSSDIAMLGASSVHRQDFSGSTVSSCVHILQHADQGPKNNQGRIPACPLWGSVVIYLDRLGCTEVQKGVCHIIIHPTSSQQGKCQRGKF